ncbi:MAG: spore coat protein CotH [Butyrivibrio sp.]|uniref:CotH kinase family protein n=1 Tax=Butyrivibrio sp. TaxID=28121 RepID=UPI001EC4FE33|nr:CotH kinase family protein [Butyrivibrio sp.]MBE5841255.1 spore coat protein CotH [Butyrivibrio sp.]
MSTHKLIDKVCIFITIIAVLVTVLFMNGSAIGITADDSVEMGYEELLFDDSYVHTIDIEIDDWDSFLETATSEEYSAANVTIDGETVYNVGIRGKGNTSLSTVEQLDSDRYSFKIEFDCYESSNTYHGLDKLCLNNLIQDYTMMKDYLAYKLMGEFGVDAPLVSYVYITVNGEDWGLYLAVEAAEDSFLERNNGTNYGNLYKPDTLSMGGGRGNGRDFDMKDVDSNDMPEGFDKKPGDNDDMPEGFGKKPGDRTGELQEEGPEEHGGMGSDDSKLKYIDDDIDSYSNIFDSAKTNIKKSDKKRLINSLKTLSEGIEEQDADKIAEAVDVDAVMRYMVVHNFLVNGDSYTGSMIHNYYLYEEDGLLSMIPWDYNLAYGTFQGQDADAAVNDPIDTPLSITEDSDDRPMFSWITSCDEYTEMYHEYYADFLEQFYTSGYLQDLIETTYDMISEYVEKDPTKFCTTEEFETAVETMKTFVELRCQSISGQLDGTIGSTDAQQEENPDALIDASSINLSDMGSMGGGMGGGPGQGDGEHSGPPSGGPDQNSDG